MEDSLNMDEIMDRISGLPPFIIHHIMSYLSPKEVAQISTLSKRWNELCTSFPIFDFDQTYFFTKDKSRQITSLNGRERMALPERWTEFMEFVDSSLFQFCKLQFCMHKFRLYITMVDVKESTPRVDKWIRLAKEKEVKELDLEFLTYSLSPYMIPVTVYTLPRLIFSARSVTSLRLVGCKLGHISDTIRFDSLRKLTLGKVFTNEEMVQKLTSECPLLEELFFSHCWRLKRLCVSKAPKLKTMILNYCSSLQRITISSNQLKKFRVSRCINMKALDLDTPNLLSFTYEDSFIPTSRINALCPWRVKLSSYFTFDTQRCLKLREFLRLSNQIETLSINANVRSFKLEEFRKSYPSPLCNVVNLELYTRVPPSEYRILLDGLLWICYPKTLSLQTYPLKDPHKLFESFYNELKNRDESCCKSHDIKCWRHYLRDIKVESFQYHQFQLDWCFAVSTEKA